MTIDDIMRAVPVIPVLVLEQEMDWTALALSLVTGQPFRLERIRAGRPKPGLSRQHLTAVDAARTIGRAEVTGASLGSTTLEFRPGMVTPGDYRFAVGTAGSATKIIPLRRWARSRWCGRRSTTPVGTPTPGKRIARSP